MDHEHEQPESDSYFTKPLYELKPFHLAAMVSRIMSELDRQDDERRKAEREAAEARASIRGDKRKPAEDRSPTGKRRRKDRGMSRTQKAQASGAEG